ncbi:MAG TPA: agenet domain-containing protein [Chthonomonadaceae bacterium]|nr:agenet domain-containing protein [Chthonomonadaceae bacterium]
MMADCCTSGSLALEAAKRPTNIAYACLTSVYAHSTSTGNWTYTDALVRGFQGDPVMDTNGDGVISLDELARYIQRQMAFVEEQKAIFAVTGGFPTDLTLTDATGKRGKGAGQSVTAQGSDGAWEKAEVRDKKPGQVQVRFAESHATEWVPADHIRAFEPKDIAVGARVQAKDDDGKWYPATVKTVWYGLVYVHYDRYNAEYDNWVGPDNLQLKP